MLLAVQAIPTDSFHADSLVVSHAVPVLVNLHSLHFEWNLERAAKHFR